MNNFNIQLNDNTEIKTINELVRDSFNTKNSIVDLSFFYEEKKEPEEIKNIKDIRNKFSQPHHNFQR